MKKLYVGNLAYSVTEADLESKFGEFGSIESVNIIIDRATGNSKGFGFIEFQTADQAQSACSLDGTDFGGRNLRVNVARERSEGGGGGGQRKRFREYND